MTLRPLLFALLLGWLSSASAAQSGHNHAGHVAPDPCAHREAPASLRCALATSGVFDEQGRLWLAWAFGGHVYVNRSDDRGATFSPPVPVNRIPERVAADGENRPKIAVADGRVYVSWTLRTKGRYTGDVRFSRSLDGGADFAEPITVNDNRERISHRFDALAVAPNGDLYIAWLDKRDLAAAKREGRPYRGAALYYARSTDGGASFGENRKVLDHSCECCRVVMEMDRRGLPVILWRHIFGDNIRDHALVRFTAAERFAEPSRASHDQWKVDACPHHGPDLSIAEDGVYHLAWFNNAPERHGLFYSRSEDDGATLAEPLPFGDYEQAAAHPQVVSLGTRVYLAWKAFDGQRGRVEAMHSEDGGRSWSAPWRVADTAGESDHPQLLRDGERVYLSWQSRDEGYRLIPLDGGPR